MDLPRPLPAPDDDAGWPGCVGAALPASVIVLPGGVAAAPRWKGAYALAFTLVDPVAFSYRGAGHSLPPGHYVYAGSAYGPGGIGARLGRHFRRDKKRHWHIDHLTASAGGMTAFAIKGGSECAILARLGALPGFGHVLAGFGSSDCAACRSHLLVWRPPA